MATVVVLGSTNVSAYVLDDLIQPGTHDLFAHVRIGSFSLRPTTPVLPTNDDFFKITRTDGTTVAFAGLAKMPDMMNDTRIESRHDVVGQGWEALLDRINITTGMNLAVGTVDMVLVKAALDTFYSSIGVGMTHVLYPQRADLQFKVVPAGVWSFRALMDWIVSQTGATWWIDPATKAFHYNDYESFAPWVLSDVAGTGKKVYALLDRHRDAVARAVRVNVTDGGLNSTLCTDWDAWYEITSKSANEPNAPTARFTQLPDIADSTLDTEEKRKRAGFSALVKSSPRLVLTALMRDEGLDIGMQADIISATYGTGAVPDPWLNQWELGVTSATEDLDTGMGRFVVTKVTPKALGRDQWSWTVELGDPNEIMGALIGQAG